MIPEAVADRARAIGAKVATIATGIADYVAGANERVLCDYADKWLEHRTHSEAARRLAARGDSAGAARANAASMIAHAAAMRCGAIAPASAANRSPNVARSRGALSEQAVNDSVALHATRK